MKSESSNKISSFRMSEFWVVRQVPVAEDGKCSICGEKFDENDDLSHSEFKFLQDEVK